MKSSVLRFYDNILCKLLKNSSAEASQTSTTSLEIAENWITLVGALDSTSATDIPDFLTVVAVLVSDPVFPALVK